MQAQTVRAFNLETGVRVWVQELSSGQRRDKTGNGAGLALEDGKLVVASGFGFIAAMGCCQRGGALAHRDDSTYDGGADHQGRESLCDVEQ